MGGNGAPALLWEQLPRAGRRAHKKGESAEADPETDFSLYADFLRFDGLDFPAALFASFALSFAVNSCLTLTEMASVSTLYKLAASRRTVAAFVREAASKMAVSTSSRESVTSSARRRNPANVLLIPPSSRFCRMPASPRGSHP